MIFYIVLIILLIFLFGKYSIGKKHKPALFSFIGIIILILVLACRFDIGADYSQYYTNYLKSYQRDVPLNYEPLNNLLFYLSTPFQSPQLLIALYAILTVSIIGFAIYKNTDDFFIGIITYVALFYLSSFSTIRQSLALAIILYSYQYLKKDNWIKYYLCVLTASLFHYSAAVSIIFPLLYKCKIKYLMWILGGTAIFFVFGTKMLERIPYLNKYAIYLTITSNFGGGNIQKLFMWGVLIFLWFAKSPKNISQTPLMVLCTFGCVFPAIFGAHLGGRLAQYMYIFLCISAANILHKKSFLIKSLYIITLICWFLGYVYIGSDGDNIKAFIPYQTIFEVDTTTPIFK